MSEVVLITGFPALAARKMLERIIEREPETRVVAVVLEKLLPRAASFVEQLPAEQRGRIQILEGDVGAMDLGLSGREYRDLASAVTRVHHLAHLGYVGVERDDARYVNVGGAVEMIELARAADRLRCVVHHSTAHVSGDRTGVVFEHELDEGQTFHNPAQETRFIAERALRRAMPRLPIAVVRPTTIVGDSHTGEFERLEGANLLAMIVLGLPNALDVPLLALGHGPLDVVPIDHVVAAAHAIGLHPDAPGRTYHITSGDELSARQVLDMIATAGGRRVAGRGRFPTQVLNALMRTPGVSRFVHEPRALLQQLAAPARYDTRNTRKILAQAELTCPPLESYVETWVNAVEEELQRRRAP